MPRTGYGTIEEFVEGTYKGMGEIYIHVGEAQLRFVTSIWDGT